MPHCQHLIVLLYDEGVADERLRLGVDPAPEELAHASPGHPVQEHAGAAAGDGTLAAEADLDRIVHIDY